jgi:hypothetical protein
VPRGLRSSMKQVALIFAVGAVIMIVEAGIFGTIGKRQMEARERARQDEPRVYPGAVRYEDAVNANRFSG